MTRPALSRRSRAGVALLGVLAAGLTACRAEPVAAARTVVRVDPSVTHQTIAGWSATAYAGQEFASYPLYSEEMLDLAVDYLGINRVRLEVRSGAENRRDLWSEYRAGDVDYPAWRAGRYATVNDNDDPTDIDWRGFHFSELDHTVATVVEPLRARLAARGEKLFVNLNYVAFTPQIGPGGTYLHDDPEEYAEFVVATFLHLRRRHGWVPDSLELILEPDNVPQWDGGTIGRALVAVAARLAERGFTPSFAAPSNTSMGAAVRYFDAMVEVPGAVERLGTLTYHRYREATRINLKAIAARARRYGLETAMLEHIRSGYASLHEDLKVGRNSAWQQFTLGGPEAKNSGGSYFLLAGDPARPRVVPADRTRYLRQLFAYVRAGAVRVGATSDQAGFDPLAFVHPDGGMVVVVEARRRGRFEVEGLPAGTYEVSYTLGRSDASPPAQEAAILPAARVREGRRLSVRVPAAGGGPTYGVVTIRRLPETS